MITQGPAARLEALRVRYDLDASQADTLATLLQVLEADELAPTTVRDPARAVDVHLADSLAALEFPELTEAEAIVDLGAGAGFPGVVLAVALRSASVTLLESNGRKCGFMTDMLSRLGVSNAHVVCARVEEWSEGSASQDVAVARALAAQPVVLEYAAPLLRIGGHLLDWRGMRSEAEEREAVAAARELGLTRDRVQRVEPYGGARDHHIHVFAKLTDTPARYPRRAGIARKRPLGG